MILTPDVLGHAYLASHQHPGGRRYFMLLDMSLRLGNGMVIKGLQDRPRFPAKWMRKGREVYFIGHLTKGPEEFTALAAAASYRLELVHAERYQHLPLKLYRVLLRDSAVLRAS